MNPLPHISIVLRDFVLDDLSRYGDWQRPGHHWQEWDGPYYPRATETEVNAKIEGMRDQILTHQFPQPRTSMVIADAVDDRLVGLVTWYWQGQETNWVSIGIVIFDPADWGKGIGHAGLSLWIDYLFQAMPTSVRLDMRTWSGNVGMMRLAEKLGFQLEARFRKARIVKGAYYDGLGYGILREEWEAMVAQNKSSK
jgi:RimJ/RimL family protein N-acetyltransferase